MNLGAFHSQPVHFALDFFRGLGHLRPFAGQETRIIADNFMDPVEEERVAAFDPVFG